MEVMSSIIGTGMTSTEMDKMDPCEPIFHYIYNTKTGILKIFDQTGNLIYSGPPAGYSWP
jgi:hypothetical protein